MPNPKPPRSTGDGDAAPTAPAPTAVQALEDWFATHVKGSALASDTDSYNRLATQFNRLRDLIPSN